MPKINLGQPQEAAAPQRSGKVVIATSFNKISERLDADGNVVDARTKRIIKRANEGQDSPIQK